ncbi:MAG: HAD-IA family hydrolase [bacterium]
MQSIDTILFDLDGTLVDSIGLIADTLVKTLKEFVPDRTFASADIDLMIGPPLAVTFARFRPEADVIQTMIERYRAIYKADELNSIVIYPHAVETLRTLKRRGFHLGLVTTKFTESAMPSLRHFAIDCLFDVIIGLESVTRHKPHPEPIEKALAAFPHGAAVMVGDTEGDMLAGKAAGILTCGVAWSFQRAAIEALHPDFWIHDYAELIPAIEQYHMREE